MTARFSQGRLGRAKKVFITEGGGGGSSAAQVRSASVTPATSTWRVDPVRGADAATPGAWVDAIAATSAAGDYVVLSFRGGTNVSATTTTTLLDVGFWNGSSYDVKVPSIQIGNLIRGTSIHFPFDVPQGTRIGLRIQSSSASVLPQIGVEVLKLGIPNPPNSAHALGVNTATCSSTAVPIIVTANSVTGYGSLGTTATAVDWIMLCHSGAGATTMQNGDFLVDVAKGAIGQEEVVLSQLGWQGDTAEAVTSSAVMARPVTQIPSGTLIRVRSQGNTVTQAARPSVSVVCFTRV